MGLYFTDAGFNNDVLKSELPVLVDFYADWCGPCKMMGPIIDQLAEEYEGKIRIGKLDTSSNPECVQRYGIQNIPTIILFKDGIPTEKFVGLTSKAKLEELLNKVS